MSKHIRPVFAVPELAVFLTADEKAPWSVSVTVESFVELGERCLRSII